MPRSRIVLTGLVFACLLILAATLGWVGAQTTAAQTPPSQSLGMDWQKVPGAPAGVDFRNVFMANALSGVAVGKENDRGALYNLEWTALDGWRWSLAVTPADFTFRAPLWAAVI